MLSPIPPSVALPKSMAESVPKSVPESVPDSVPELNSIDLLLDIGNTRSKWLILQTDDHAAPATYLGQGVILNQDLLAHSAKTQDSVTKGIVQQDIVSPAIVPQNMVLQNVYCTCVANEETLQVWQEMFSQAQFERLNGDSSFSGLVNQYDQPAQLGTDRLAAMIGAMTCYPTQNTFIINSGTATTMDYLSGGKVFTGGWILPGLDLMLHSLGQSTAHLPQLNTALLNPALLSPALMSPALMNPNSDQRNRLEQGTSTEQAISQGVLLSQIGAITHAMAHLPMIQTIVLSGGNAPVLLPYLASHITSIGSTITLAHEPNLVLIGLNAWRIALKGRIS